MSPHPSPIRGGPSDAFERRHLAAGGQAGFADRVRAQQLTSYGGLELLRRYLRQLEIPRRLHAACTAVGGDYSGSRLALLLMALLYVGARRLEHLQYLVGDPLIRRFAGLAPVPTARTVSNWLRRFTQETLRPLVQLNQDLVLDTLAHPDVPRLTLDVDDTVVVIFRGLIVA